MEDQQLADFVLRQELLAAALAYVDDFGCAGNQGEDFPADEGVVQDDGGACEQTGCFDGEEVGVAGACANEIDLAHPSFRLPEESPPCTVVSRSTDGA